MTVQTFLITFATGVLQQAVSTRETMCCRILVEPFGTNAGRSYAGVAGMVKATGVGVIRELAAPNSVVTAIKDTFLIADEFSANKLDVSDYYFDGTNGEKALVTVWTS